MKRLLLWLGGLLLFAYLSIFAFADTNPGIGTTLTTVFNTQIHQYITTLLSPGSQVYQWTHMLMVFIMFLAVFFEILVFIKKPDIERHLTAVIWIFITMGLWAGYNTFIDVLWQTGEGLASAFQVAATGSSDPWFLSEWAYRIANSYTIHSQGFFGSIQSAILVFIWNIVMLLLEGVMKLVGMWAVWGAAVAKIIGVIFIPFLMLPATRKIFDGWFQYFVGFLILLIVLRITGVVAAITLQAQMMTIGYNCSGSLLCIDNGWTATLSETSNSLETIITMFICIALVLSSFSVAKLLASKVGEPSTGMAKGVASTATKAAAFFI